MIVKACLLSRRNVAIKQLQEIHVLLNRPSSAYSLHLSQLLARHRRGLDSQRFVVLTSAGPRGAPRKHVSSATGLFTPPALPDQPRSTDLSRARQVTLSRFLSCLSRGRTPSVPPLVCVVRAREKERGTGCFACSSFESLFGCFPWCTLVVVEFVADVFQLDCLLSGSIFY